MTCNRVSGETKRVRSSILYLCTGSLRFNYGLRVQLVVLDGFRVLDVVCGGVRVLAVVALPMDSVGGVRVRRLRLRTPSEYSGALRFRRAAPAELGEEFCGAAESCSECSPASASQTRVRIVGRVGKPGKRSRPSRHSPTKGRRGACLELTGYVNLCLRRIHSA